MMHRNAWRGNSGCSFMGNHIFGGWHYLIMLAIIITVVALVVLARRKSNNDNGAINSLKELYVKGEITEEEYLKRKDVITRK